MKVAVIILNWNQPEFTIDCVKSVLRQSYKDFQIVVVDNASTDDSVKRFESSFGKNKKVKIIKNKKNDGYAGGNNVGVKLSKSKYVVILNNDTEVEKDWLEYLVKGVKSSRNVGAVSSHEIREGSPEKINFRKTGFANTAMGYPARIKLRKPLKETELINLFAARGVSFIYRRNLVKLPFDSDYFIYAEDFKLGWSLRLKGYKNFYSTKSVVHHYHNLTKKKGSKKINSHFVFLGERNQLLNFFTLYEKRSIFKLLLPMVIQKILINFFEPRKIPGRLKSYFWLSTHIKYIKRKRKHIQKQRKVPDEKIFENLTYKVYDDVFVQNTFLKIILKIINLVSFLYFKLVRIKTIEM
jgi:GT2 family glycosyltransferase